MKNGNLKYKILESMLIVYAYALQNLPDLTCQEDWVYLTIFKSLAVNTPATVIFLFLALGVLASPAFAQFGGIDYDIRGGEILGFEIDAEDASMIIQIDARSRGE